MKASCTFTRPNDTTAYAAGDVVGGVLTFVGAEIVSQADLLITSTDFMAQVSSIPSGMTSFRLHLYSARPGSAYADNAAWDLPAGDRTSYLGYIDMGSQSDVGSTLFTEQTQVNKHIRLPGSGGPLYGYLVTNGAFTPTASAVKVINLHMVRISA